MLNQSDKKKLKQLKLRVEKEKKRLRITEPKFTIQVDTRTKKLNLCYSVPVDKGLDINKQRIVRNKQVRQYLKNLTLDDTDAILNNLKNYSDDIIRKQSTILKQIGSDKDTLHHWIRVYTENTNRKGNMSVSERSLRDDKACLETLLTWVTKYNPQYVNIWKWTDDGKDVMMKYFEHKQTVVDEKVLWKDTTVSSQYGRIRAFFNYLSDNVKDYPPNLLNKLPIKRQKVITETFTRMEMDRCLQFLNKNKDNPKYEWFTPIFKVLVETGMRVSEVMKMRIKDVDVYERKIKILGKGRDGGKERWIHLRSDKVWSIIENQIYDENKEIRDTEWVFWVKYQNVSSGKTYYVENMNKPFNTSGFQHRFKDMIKELKMSDNLTPHALRRYFITEMLKKTKGNIPLVAQLVGHNTWDIVKHYTKNVVDENVDVNVGVI